MLSQLYLSAVTIAEIRYGIELLEPGDQRDFADAWLQKTIRPMFEGRLIEVDEEVLLTWTIFAHRGRKAGRTYSQADLLLAATAIRHGLVLVTRNVRDFVALPVQLFNPWD